MRKIIFRGKRKGGAEWIYGDLNHIDGMVFIFDRSENAPLNSPDWFEVDPETVGQFTGISDCTGKHIYEKDRVKPLDEKLTTKTVEWSMQKGGFYLIGGGYFQDFNVTYGDGDVYIDSTIKIIE